MSGTIELAVGATDGGWLVVLRNGKTIRIPRPVPVWRAVQAIEERTHGSLTEAEVERAVHLALDHALRRHR